MDIYSTTYRDQHGEETTTIQNDSQQLSVTIRGITFSGEDFDSLEVQNLHEDSNIELFVLHNGSLAACELECDMPISIMSNEKLSSSNLHVHLKLGKPLPQGFIENEELQLCLDFDGISYTSCGRHGWFDDELLEIQEALPDRTYLRCCHSCAFSDYHPSGSGLFGNLACFRDNKKAYLKIKSKVDLFEIWETRTGYVQETYLCPAFEKRVPGAGYRG